MYVEFHDKDHRYVSDTGEQYTSVTTIVGLYKEVFPEIKASESCVLKEGGKWFGMNPVEVRKIWRDERDRSTTMGTWYHKTREDAIVNPIQCPVVHGVKQSLSQGALKDGIYPEYIVYHPEYGIAGQIDYLEVKKNKFRIVDYKTSKEVHMKSFLNKTMKPPLNRVPDCSLYHYNLQLSLYAAMIMYHNPQMKIGELVIEHVTFEIKELDKYGYPVYEQLANGDYIVKDIIPFKLPYMANEVKWLLLDIHNKARDQKPLAKSSIRLPH